MRKYVRMITAFITTIAMMMASGVTVNAAGWKQDGKGWWVENADGTYLVNTWYQSPDSGLWYYMGTDGYMLTNTWYQSPNSKLWYYMGADGHMLTNTTTPDGYTVGADGAWITKQTQATNTKDTAAIREIVEAYKEYRLTNDFQPDSYVFVCLNDDDIPECICTNGRWLEILTHDGGYENNVESLWKTTWSKIYYGENNFCILDGSAADGKYFYQIIDNRFVSKGHSLRAGNRYQISSRGWTSKAIYDDYNNSFGTVTEISLEYEDTYRSIDAAYEAYIAQ